MGRVARSELAAGYAQPRQQSLVDLGGHIGLQCDQVLRRSGEAGLPQQAIVADVDGFQRDHQVVALLQEMSGEHRRHVKFAPNLLPDPTLLPEYFCVSEEGRTSSVRV